MTPPLEDRLRYAREVVGKDPLASDLGLKVASVELARAEVRLKPLARHLNALGRVHGSTIYALADQALAVAGNTLERPALIMQMKIDFMAGAGPETELIALAEPLELKSSIGLWQVKISTSDGDSIAQAQGLSYHKSPPRG